MTKTPVKFPENRYKIGIGIKLRPQGTYSYRGMEGRTDGRAKKQKLIPSDFLRKGWRQ